MLSLGGQQLRILALFLSLLGLVFLFFILQAEYAKMEVSQIKGRGEGERVFFSGIVEKIDYADWGAKISVCDSNSCINVKVENEKYNAALLSRGGIVRVWGAVEEYMGGKSVSADKIERA